MRQSAVWSGSCFQRAASGPRVCLMINIQQSLLRDVGVDLGGRQISMAEQFLDAAEIGAAIQQVGGEAVSQACEGWRSSPILHATNVPPADGRRFASSGGCPAG